MNDTTAGRKLELDGTKLSWHAERVEAWLRGERIAPITIDMALTRGCNYRCEYCYSALQENPRKKITRDIMYDFLDDASEIGVKGISLVSDGESSMVPFFSDVIVRGSQNGLSMAMGTNGYLLSREHLQAVLPALTYLRFNISAADPRRYAEIHGVPEPFLAQVCENIRAAVAIKRSGRLPVTIGLQMVLMPAYKDQILPLARLGCDLGVDYLVIKHCSDDEKGSLGVDYSAYKALHEVLKEAESLSAPGYQVTVKWSKIEAEGKRSYLQCYGPPFILQLSGSGLVAPCGMFFGEQYKRYWIGNIVDTRFKEIWQSERYWQIMDLLGSTQFDAQTMCGCLCLQHKVNEFLWDLKRSGSGISVPTGVAPLHINFV